ncbi:penicillin-binding transpeptidase domain-containing protein [Salsuginibacillus kocurii]|uniref:penicillin-binding transpeptidase domain-containing protein n=1 Tax=Salsuginibacillus kocurii TaxID=427078 RepID=UPI00037F7B29|nr:penicillin-binding transpeptidase domain-containing protein [Salsuginibacillus kocurii]
MMRYKAYYGVGLLLFILLTACTAETDNPELTIERYTDSWEAHNYEEMYATLVDPANHGAGDRETFVERAETIAAETGLEDIDVNVESRDFEEEEIDLEELEEITYPVEVEMETVAGELAYETEVTAVKPEDEEEEADWLIEFRHDHLFAGMEEASDTVQARTVKPERGDILDRHGDRLALNGEIYEAGLIPGELEEESEEEAADILGLSEEAVEQALAQDWVQDDSFVPLEELPQNDERVDDLLDIPGVLLNTGEARLYPLGEKAAHLTGYANTITAEELEEAEWDGYTEHSTIGKSGLESVYEEELRGEPGVVIEVRDEEGNVRAEPVEREVEHGEDIGLTIDAGTQQDLAAEMEGEAGTAVAMDPGTGELLALVNTPAYDPEEMVFGVSEEQWEDWQTDDKEPMLNRFGQRYVPGSVFKPITAAAGIEEGTLDPDEVLTIEGEYWERDDWGGYRVRRVNEEDTEVDLSRAMTRSDNIYFAEQGLELGTEAMESWSEAFGFTEDNLIDYPVYSSRLSNEGIESEVLLADTSFGQGEVLMNPIHLAAVYTTFSQDGDMMQPTLIDDGETNIWEENLIGEDTAEIIEETLIAVVEDPDGTANDVYDENITLAGKTGTAELKSALDEEDADELGWFIGYDYEDEDLLVAMMVEDVQGRGGAGHVVPKVQAMFE